MLIAAECGTLNQNRSAAPFVELMDNAHVWVSNGVHIWGSINGGVGKWAEQFSELH